MLEPINIFSGAEGLGAALTNPTGLARRKGCLVQGYGVRFSGRDWIDVETAYHVLGTGVTLPAERDTLMIELIAAKFRQHPALFNEVLAAGGAPWLMQCSHFTGARSPQAQSWEGAGTASRFIRNLVAGFLKAQEPATEQGQGLLF